MTSPASHFQFVKFEILTHWMETCQEIEFDKAIRAFHYFKKFWKPKLNEKLDCSHEADILFDIFAAQTCSGNETALGPYPRAFTCC